MKIQRYFNLDVMYVLIFAEKPIKSEWNRKGMKDTQTEEDYLDNQSLCHATIHCPSRQHTNMIIT